MKSLIKLTFALLFVLSTFTLQAQQSMNSVSDQKVISEEPEFDDGEAGMAEMLAESDRYKESKNAKDADLPEYDDGKAGMAALIAEGERYVAIKRAKANDTPEYDDGEASMDLLVQEGEAILDARQKKEESAQDALALEAIDSESQNYFNKHISFKKLIMMCSESNILKLDLPKDKKLIHAIDFNKLESQLREDLALLQCEIKSISNIIITEANEVLLKAEMECEDTIDEAEFNN